MVWSINSITLLAFHKNTIFYFIDEVSFLFALRFVFCVSQFTIILAVIFAFIVDDRSDGFKILSWQTFIESHTTTTTVPSADAIVFN